MANHPDSPDLIPIDRGRARYFHGRDKIIANFNTICQNALEQQGGTTFLIQGSPGAGKTALLHELCDVARHHRWHVATIFPPALRDYQLMAQALGHEITTRTESHWKIDAKVGSGGKSYETLGIGAVSGVLAEAVPKSAGLLLEVDEAQDLSDYTQVPDTPDIKATLKAIHNGKLGRPVILLAGGLGLTQRAFYDLGISRFQARCLTYLERLSAKSERAVIRDWLVRGGEAKGDVGPWIDAIAQETDGWPQHIVSFAEPASQVIRQSEGMMTPQGLARVLDAGRVLKAGYYEQRCYGLEWEDQALLGALVYHAGKGRVWPVRSVERLFDIRSQSSGSSGVEVKNTALAKGVLATTRKGLHIPIPSMEDWLVGCYVEHVNEPTAEAKNLSDSVVDILPQLGISTKALPPARDKGQQKRPSGLTSGFGSPDDGLER